MLRTKLSHSDITERIIGSAMNVHRKLGPGLLESAYEQCFAHRLRKNGLDVSQQVPISLNFDDLIVTNAYKIDLIVEEAVIVEIKAVEKLSPIHVAQAITYLKFTA